MRPKRAAVAVKRGIADRQGWSCLSKKAKEHPIGKFIPPGVCPKDAGDLAKYCADSEEYYPLYVKPYHDQCEPDKIKKMKAAGEYKPLSFEHGIFNTNTNCDTGVETAAYCGYDNTALFYAEIMHSPEVEAVVSEWLKEFENGFILVEDKAVLSRAGMEKFVLQLTVNKMLDVVKNGVRIGDKMIYITRDLVASSWCTDRTLDCDNTQELVDLLFAKATVRFFRLIDRIKKAHRHIFLGPFDPAKSKQYSDLSWENEDVQRGYQVMRVGKKSRLSSNGDRASRVKPAWAPPPIPYIAANAEANSSTAANDDSDTATGGQALHNGKKRCADELADDAAVAKKARTGGADCGELYDDDAMDIDE